MINIRVSKITLYDKGIEDEKMSEICEGDMSKVQSLLLGWNQITCIGIKYFSQAKWDSLTVLYLWSNKIKIQGCKFLSRARMKLIQKISLNKNQLECIGLFHLCKSNWSQLKFAELQHNKLGEGSGESLSKTNWKKLEHINISHNLIKDDSALHLVQLVSQRRTIKRIWIRTYNVSRSKQYCVDGITRQVSSLFWSDCRSMIINLINYYMKAYLPCLSIIFLACHVNSSIIVSPFDYSTVYGPSGMYRLSYSATLTGSSSTFTVTYPTTFTAPPLILYSITALTFNRGIKYNLAVTSITNSSATANIVYDSTISKASFFMMIMDSSLFNATFTYFSYSIPPGVNTPQTFAITGNQNHDASFLVGIHAYLGPFPAGYAPTADSSTLIDSSNVISANLSITFDPTQLTIAYYQVYFVDFQISSFVAKPYAGIGQQFAIYGTNGIATDPTQTGNYVSSYSNSYFTGLQTIYDGQFLFGMMSFDIVAMISSNIFYYTSQLLFVTYKCPGSFPYTDSNRTLCYSGCDVGYYSDGQYMCQPCNPNCFTCYNTSTNCTSCVYPYVLVYGFVCGCDETSYQVTYLNGSLSCVVCSTKINGCFNCTSATHCLSCMNNMVLISPLVCSCPAGTLTKTVGTEIICVQLTSWVAPKIESCTNNMIANMTICTCPTSQNLTFIGGNCV